MGLKIVVTSDHHLGYEKCDKASFNSFLDRLREEGEVTDLVLFGDVVDMWRRDSSGVFLENWDTVERLIMLGKKTKVHYVVGNHDFHALQLQNHLYPFEFVKKLTLTDGNYTYNFLHGYEFDSAQREPLMEALCRVMSDEAGSFESGVWAMLTRDWGDCKYILSIISEKRSIRKEVETLVVNPEIRLKNTLDQIERLACSGVRPQEILVFGHTHKPFISKMENVANSGS